MKFESLLFACVIAILLCVLLVDGKAIHKKKHHHKKSALKKGKGDSQQAETQPIDTPDAGAAAGDADPTADAASNDDDAAMTPPAAADESDDQTENQQQNQLQNPLPVTGTVPPLQATTTPSPSLLAGAPPQPEAAQPEAAPAEDEAASGEGSAETLAQAPVLLGGHMKPGPPPELNDIPLAPRYCNEPCSPMCAPACYDWCCFPSIQAPSPPMQPMLVPQKQPVLQTQQVAPAPLPYPISYIAPENQVPQPSLTTKKTKIHIKSSIKNSSQKPVVADKEHRLPNKYLKELNQ